MFKKQKEKFSRFLSNDVGIDLGTANTLVYVRGKGIVLNEPSVVAVNEKTGQVVAVGAEAKNMLGRTPPHINAVKPIVGGVISDFEVTEEMIAYLIRRAESGSRRLLGPRVVVGVPSGVTNVETRAVRDATRNNGAREVYIIEEPMAAALGINLPVHDPVGTMVIDVGGGTTDIAVISLGGVVRSKSVKIAGEKLDEDIISYIRSEFKILIGEKTAEYIKTTIGSVMPLRESLESTIRGRDLITGLPREVVITDTDLRTAMSSSIDSIAESVKEVLENTPPEIIGDIMKNGVHLVGGGALLGGLGDFFAESLGIPVHVASDPLTAVARGAGVVLEDLGRYRDILIQSDDDVSSQN